MSGYAQAVEWADKLAAEGLAATVDPRGATPPCVFITHRESAYVSMESANVTFEVALLASPPWNADAWHQLDAWESRVAAVLDVERYRVVSYRLSVQGPPFPAFLFTVQKECELVWQ